jgi:tRNA 2-thiouridine synthesizing protein A
MESDPPMTTIVLDTKGLNCPLPVLRAKKALREVPAGGVLRVLATDPGAVQDFEAFCQVSGNQFLAWTEADGVYTLDIRKSG